MLENSCLLRVVAYPRHFSDDALAIDTLFRFLTDDDVTFALSVGVGDLLPDEERRKEFGSKTVESMNLALGARLDRSLEPTEVSKYLGYYWITYGDLLKVLHANYTVTAYWKPECGVLEHGHIEIRDNGLDLPKKAKKAARRHLISRIVRVFQGPLRQISARDEQERAFLEAIDIPMVPQEHNPIEHPN